MLVCLKTVKKYCSFFGQNIVTCVRETWKQENPWKSWANCKGFRKAGCSWGKVAFKRALHKPRDHSKVFSVSAGSRSVPGSLALAAVLSQ